MKEHGVAFKQGTLEQGPATRLKILVFSKLTLAMFIYYKIVGKWFPSRRQFEGGMLFEFLGVSQPYAPPVLEDDSGLHSIVLIGPRTAPRDGRTEIFFVARNYHGIRAYAKYYTKNYDGDFLV